VITTLTSFATATDITLAELHLEAFLPADQATAELLCTRAKRQTQSSDTPPGTWPSSPTPGPGAGSGCG
jgi:hypothetical protein